MKELGLPASAQVAFLSPSSYQVMAACRLRAAFSQMRPGRAPASTSARLGNICHGVLERMVRDHSLMEPNWERLLDDVWAEEVEREGQASVAASEAERLGPPDRWPDFQLKRARLRKAARRLRGLLVALPARVEILPEEPLQAYDGRLRGRADLIIPLQRRRATSPESRSAYVARSSSGRSRRIEAIEPGLISATLGCRIGEMFRTMTRGASTEPRSGTRTREKPPSGLECTSSTRPSTANMAGAQVASQEFQKAGQTVACWQTVQVSSPGVAGWGPGAAAL